MDTRISTCLKKSALVATIFMVGIVAAVTSAQDRLPQYPGYAQYQKMSGEIRGAIKMGSLSVTWKDGGQSFDYQWDGKSYHYDIASRKATEDTSATAQNPPQYCPGQVGAD